MTSFATDHREAMPMTIVDSLRLRAAQSRLYGRRMVWIGAGFALFIILLLPAWSLSLAEYGASVVFQNSTDSDPKWIILTSGVLLRLAAPALAAYVVGVFFQLARYHSRMADHQECVADAICLAGSDARQLQELLVNLEPKHIHFGKDPHISLKGLAGLISPANVPKG